MGVFRDFIPAGEDVGALGSGFADFVPTNEVVAVKPEHIANLQPVEEPTKEVKKEKKG